MISMVVVYGVYLISFDFALEKIAKPEPNAKINTNLQTSYSGLLLSTPISILLDTWWQTYLDKLTHSGNEVSISNYYPVTCND